MVDPEMDLRAVLAQVADTYDRRAGTGTGVLAQDLLRSIEKRRLPLPAGFRAEGHGGQASATLSPWIGIFNPDITNHAKHGLYLAYIFATDLTSVSLTLQQGVEKLRDSFGWGKALEDQLQQKARRLQATMLEETLRDWLEPLKLLPRAQDRRQHAYQASSVAARRYDTANLPEEHALRADLWNAARILQEAARVERELWRAEDSDNPSVEYQPSQKEDLVGFRPKDDSDYVATIGAHTQHKQRRHETLIREFHDYVNARGFQVRTPHPKDLVLSHPQADREWLVEAKVVQGRTPAKAVREAVAQLLEYRHFLCDRDRPPHPLALFTEMIPEPYVAYLETLGIGSVWKTPDGWAGSALAATWGVINP